MFRISRRTDYSVRVLLCLARRPGGTRLAAQTVQQEMLVPRPFLQRIIADLSRAGLVHTYAGPNGGVELARPAAAIHLRQIWEAMEGPLLISDCLGTANPCPLEVGCPVQPRWRRLQTLLAQELEAITLAQLAQDAEQLAGKVPSEALTRVLLPIEAGG